MTNQEKLNAEREATGLSQLTSELDALTLKNSSLQDKLFEQDEYISETKEQIELMN